MKEGKEVRWVDSTIEPQEKPDPRYPDGVDIDVSQGKEPACTVELPYPFRRIGWVFVVCHTCGQRTILTTAGRPDDPKSVRTACLKQVH